MEESFLESFGRLSLQQQQQQQPRPPAPPPPRGTPPRRHSFRKHLYLLRGLPGSGKTTLAREEEYTVRYVFIITWWKGCPAIQEILHHRSPGAIGKVEEHAAELDQDNIAGSLWHHVYDLGRRLSGFIKSPRYLRIITERNKDRALMDLVCHRQLQHDFPRALIFSTDDFFFREDGAYEFNPDFLEEAHEWNQKRARKAMRNGISPIIIDNTNLHAWEMKPYAVMALENNYEVIFREPDTRWKFNVQELARRNIHGVPREKIHRMKERYEHDVTFHSVLHAEKPSRMNRNQDRNNPSPSDGAGYWNPCAEFPTRRAHGGFTNESSFNRRGGCHHGY
ncbi:LOW QUALITY PROTEIN: NEDD4-binding protein 2-like 1 [Lynx canadensis]|uniref:LOW QUALITY PROTEIN: NEDD4-binding protein 2-like 1 n=1 Tax=Lynx canadensis TaxID=61383 RepID=UPI0011B06BDF|nr:LOW QUALITY PROTEIN: NEDD4-binding protein 2-like 1 [Lynx canadensis]